MFRQRKQDIEEDKSENNKQSDCESSGTDSDWEQISSPSPSSKNNESIITAEHKENAEQTDSPEKLSSQLPWFPLKPVDSTMNSSKGTSSGESLDCDPTSVVEEVALLRRQQELLEATSSFLGSSEITQAPEVAKSLMHQKESLVSENARLHSELMKSQAECHKKAEETLKREKLLQQMVEEKEKLQGELIILKEKATQGDTLMEYQGIVEALCAILRSREFERTLGLRQMGNNENFTLQPKDLPRMLSAVLQNNARCTESLQKAESTIEDLKKNRIKEIEEKCNQVREECQLHFEAKLKKESAKEESEKKGLQFQLQHEEERKAQLQIDYNLMQTRFHKASQEIRELSCRLQQEEGQKVQLQMEYNSLKTARDIQESELDALQENLERRQFETLEKKNLQITDLTNERNLLKTRLKKNVQQVFKLHQDVASLTHKLDSSHAQTEQALKDLNQAKQQVASLTTQAQELEGARVQTAETLAGDLDQAKQEVASLTAQVQELESARAQTEQALKTDLHQAKQEEDEGLMKQLTSLTVENRSLLAELKNTKDKAEHLYEVAHSGTLCQKCPKLEQKIQEVNEQVRAILPENEQVKQLVRVLVDELQGIDRTLETLVAIELENRGTINVEIMQSLTEMGFSSAKAHMALQRTKNSLVEAIELLATESAGTGPLPPATLDELLKNVFESIKSRIHTLHLTASDTDQDGNKERTPPIRGEGPLQHKAICCSRIRPGDLAVFLKEDEGSGDMYALSTDENCRYKLAEESKAMVGEDTRADQPLFNENFLIGSVIHISSEDEDITRSTLISTNADERTVLEVVVSPVEQDVFHL